MNITFGVAAISEHGRQLLPSIWRDAIALADKAYGMENSQSILTDRRGLINAQSLQGTWDAPTWITDEHGTVSLSQPPVSYINEVSATEWRDWALRTLRDDDGRNGVHPGYFGISLWNDGGFEAWNDAYGFGRAYVVENRHFVAVGNHIGMASLFSDSKLEVDTFGADVLAQVGFWPERHSPISAVRRLDAGEVVQVGNQDQVSTRTYSDPQAQFGAREPQIDYAEIAASMAVLTSNAGALAKLTPNVHLSGGQDSRLTAAAWVAGGRPGVLQTIGTLPGETAVATRLVAALDVEQSLAERGLEHKVIKPNPRRLAEFSVEERLDAAMLLWDGDFAPARLRSVVKRPPAASRLVIGGANGEVMHGIHYASRDVLQTVRSLAHPLDRLHTAFPHKLQAPETRAAALEFFENQKESVNDLGQTDATALNIFQMTSKYRRWINAQLGGTSFTLLLNPIFVRAAIDLSPEQRLEREMQKSLSRELVPAWEDVPYYKATHGETTTAMKPRGIRTWETSPGSMERLIQDRSSWKRWFDITKMASLERAVKNGQGNSAHETTLNMAYVLDAIPGHVSQLEERRISLWRQARP